MKIVVIGSNSFSGSHFVKEALDNEHQVWGVSRSSEPEDIFLPYKWGNNSNQLDNFSFMAIDINAKLNLLTDLIEKVRPEIIVNFAAQGMVAESWLNPTHWYQTNLISQVRLHEYIREKKFLKKYVHITTPEVYGDTNGKWISESDYFRPTTPYATSRAACDLHLTNFYKAYDFPVVFTRAANVYGPGQQLYRIIPRAFLSMRSGKPMQLHGGGYSVRSFIHIKDVVEATLKLALEGEPGSSWHISTKESISIRELVQNICILTNSNFDELIEETKDRLGKDQSYLLNSQKLRNCLNWEDKIDIHTGLKDTLKWIDLHLPRLKKLPWEYIHKI